MHLEGPCPTLFISVLDWTPEVHACSYFSVCLILWEFKMLLFLVLLSLNHVLSNSLTLSPFLILKCIPKIVCVCFCVHVCVHLCVCIWLCFLLCMNFSCLYFSPLWNSGICEIQYILRQYWFYWFLTWYLCFCLCLCFSFSGCVFLYPSSFCVAFSVCVCTYTYMCLCWSNIKHLRCMV